MLQFICNVFGLCSWRYFAFKKPITPEDLNDCNKDFKSERLYNDFIQYWDSEVKRAQRNHRNPRLLFAVLRYLAPWIIGLSLVNIFIETYLKAMQPIFCGQLLKYFNNEISRNVALYYASGVVVSTFLIVFIFHITYHYMIDTTMKLRIIFLTLIFRKSLRLSHRALYKTPSGSIISLVTLVFNIEHFTTSIVYLIALPFNLVCLGFLSYEAVGWPSLLGILLLFLYYPIQMWLGQKSYQYVKASESLMNKRMSLMNELLNGIKIIKIYTWEKPFGQLIESIWKSELNDMFKSCYILGITESFPSFNTRLSTAVIIVSLWLLNKKITATNIFTIVGFYGILNSVLFSANWSYFFLTGFKNTFERIEEFLLMEEYEVIENGNDESPKVFVENVMANWNCDSGDVTLNDVTMKIEGRKLVAVIGQVGSGKSSFLQLLLNEMNLISGKVVLNGSISYASQDPWLFNASVRENILFGLPMKKKRYDRVVSICALEQDFNLFAQRDQSLVGERGLGLSGGQRARISLARAIYKEADIYLLDDPFSAVDAKVGRHIFQECITEFLKGKLCILTTHQLQYLDDVDQIYLLNNGQVVINGSYTELMKSSKEFKQAIDNMIIDDEQIDVEKSNENIKHEIISSKKLSIDASMVAPEEKRLTSWEIYRTYFLTGGGWFTITTCLLLFIVTEIFGSSHDVMISEITNYFTQGTKDYQSIKFAIILLFALLSVTIILAFARSFSIVFICRKAAWNFHNTILHRILNCRLQCFHENASGKVLNVFSKDINEITYILPRSLIVYFRVVSYMIAIFVVICLRNYWMIIPIIIIVIVLIFINRSYVVAVRFVKELEASTKSPLFASFKSALEGIVTIRAFKTEKGLIKEFEEYLDINSCVYYATMSMFRFVSIVLDLCFTMIVSSLVFTILFMKIEINSGFVGLAITQALSIVNLLRWTIRFGLYIDISMTSVEQIIKFTTLELENDVVDDNPPCSDLSNWPNEATIEFEKVSLQYSETEPAILKNISFTINSGEKIGIVGRTGAGKSSLITAIFRFAHLSGGIIIDGVDIGKIPLKQLRSKISFIPQEPILFNATLRKNLDMFGEYEDLQLWQVLENVGLAKIYRDTSEGLNSVISNGGSNLSVGQRQLLCLARMSLKKNKIIILDEATANIDLQTDILIQKNIKEHFETCTVLTIAHRLNTVMDSDRVLVMSEGEVVDFGNPYELLQTKSGIFYKIVQQTGMATQLMYIAKEHYLNKYSSNEKLVTKVGKNS